MPVKIRKLIYISILKLMLLSSAVYSADLEINVADIQRKAALNQKQALFDLGYLTQTGQGVEQNLAKAIELYKRASDLGHRSANHNLGLIYFYGKGVRQDYLESAKWFKIGAERDVTDSQRNLLKLYYRNLIPRDEKYIEQLLKNLANKGNDEDIYALAQYYDFERADIASAEPYYLVLAEKGNTKVFNRLGSIYFKGFGDKRNFEEAYKWFKKSAEVGDKDGQYLTGMMLMGNFGISENKETAIYWLKAAAKQGQTKAIEYLDLIQNQ
ncbi:tetratricopeptide repeat protein [Acinetobacter nematophilus]|uniref:Tetratricopeptide repeat protein n=1 Tax=Acinetobacter nematophilus TaxID=2994642 RepID=A0A9X3DY14_9GAMM|nr:tetratricopeptide repeat protein [Acinetobacter nematophilus]